MFIDFGADTTTVSVYKTTYSAIWQSSHWEASNITKDICSQQIEEEDAEELKRNTAMPMPTSRKTEMTTLPTRWTGNAVLSHTY